MPKADELTGSCICGAVRISAASPSYKVGACHCGTCRRWAGGPFMEADCGTDVSFEGEQDIAVFNSSDWAERGFCRKCGSHLFYRLKDSQQHIVPVGLFGDDDRFVFERQVFIDRKPAFYSFSNETENMTEAEVFEHFGSSG